MTRTLIDISNDLLELEIDLDHLEGLPEEQAAELHEWFSELADERREERDRKLDNYCALITDLEARADVRKSEARRLAQRAQVDENKAKSLKTMLQWFFDAHTLRTVETDRYRITLARNGGKAPLLVDEVPIENLPAAFVKTTVEVNREAIREALESGEVLEFARLGERAQSIRIK
ncbi:MAG: hypothetical protein DCF22_12180 [Leptolyngbya sp.]|nr:MAG: hypothetical protein DCF22_12180 [Leptolyngbya sp.]